MNLLIEEAAKKAAVAWLAPGGAVWCAWFDDALYVVSGPGEQAVPGLAGAEWADVTLRGDHGGRIVTWNAAVTAVAPGSELWESVAPQLAAKRLNLSTSEDTLARWAAECVLSRLAPTGTVTPPTNDSHAAEALPTTATRKTKSPFRLHRVRRRPLSR